MNQSLPKEAAKSVRELSKEESTAQVLRGLISYHERMTMGSYPERDFYLDALRFALACVEEKIAY